MIAFLTIMLVVFLGALIMVTLKAKERGKNYRERISALVLSNDVLDTANDALADMVTRSESAYKELVGENARIVNLLEAAKDQMNSLATDSAQLAEALESSRTITNADREDIIKLQDKITEFKESNTNMALRAVKANTQINLQNLEIQRLERKIKRLDKSAPKTTKKKVLKKKAKK